MLRRDLLSCRSGRWVVPLCHATAIPVHRSEQAADLVRIAAATKIAPVQHVGEAVRHAPEVPTDEWVLTSVYRGLAFLAGPHCDDVRWLEWRSSG